MRLAIFLDSYEVVGGGQTNVVETALRLVRDYGYEIDIYARKILNTPHFAKATRGGQYSIPNQVQNPKLKIIRVGPETNFFNPFGRILTIFTMLYSFLKEHQKNRYNLINAHVYLSAISGKLAAIITKLPIVLTVHGTNLTDLKEKSLAARLEKQICFQTKYNAVIAVGEGYKKYPNVNKNIFIIPNGVNHLIEYPTTKNKQPTTEKFKLLFVGRLQKVKGLDVLIEAINLINDLPLVLKVVGYGYKEEEYKLKVRKIGLDKKINFLGKVEKNELAKIYQSSDLLVVPSLSEGDGIVVKEAWANGIPVLVTRCNGPEYYIEDGKDGFLIEKNNPQKLAEKIQEIMNLPKEKLVAMGRMGYEKVKERYQWNNLVVKIDQVFKNFL